MSTELDRTSLPEQIEAPGVMVVDWRSVGRPKQPARDQMIHRVAAANPDVRFGSIDVDRQALLADQWGVEAPPEVMVFRDGTLLFRHAGPLKSEGLSALLQAAFAIDMEQVRSRINGQRGHAMFVGPNTPVDLGPSTGSDGAVPVAPK
jgi:thioredoxin-like negative regulator of GroEL